MQFIEITRKFHTITTVQMASPSINIYISLPYYTKSTIVPMTENTDLIPKQQSL